MRRFLLASLMILLLPATAHAATQYASPSGSGSTCSQALPCSTSGAQSKAVPGDTIMLMDGNYGSQSWTKGGTASARLRWVAQNRFKAVFTSINSIGPYVDLGPGLQVSNPGITCGSNISPIGSGGADNYVGAHDVLVTGNWIHDVGTTGARTSSWTNSNATSWADSGCRDGGGIYVSSPSWTLTNNRIENVVSDCITSWHSPTNMKAVNNTVVNCGGGGVNVGGQSGVGGGYAANNIAVNAFLGDLYSNSTNTWVNNLVFGGRTKAGVTNDTGTIVADPGFVSSTDRHLQAGSPAIDSGTADRAPSTDIEGNVRPQGAGFDRGAYETGGAPPPPPDTTAPAGPTNFHETTPTQCSDANLDCVLPMAWTAATDNVGVDHYDDYNDGALVGQLPSSATSAAWGGGEGTCKTHSIGIQAVDAVGNKGPMVTAQATTYCPDSTPPQTTLTAQPSDGTSTSASFSFTADEPSTFECSLDGSAFASCTSPKIYSGLAVGGHVFSVRAKDTAGNVDATPATASWTISAQQTCDQSCEDAYKAQIAARDQTIADLRAKLAQIHNLSAP